MNKALFVTSERMLSDMGFSGRYKGYYYLILAIVLSLESGIQKDALTKEIYDLIACFHNVSVDSVEKCIRTCIVKAWNEDPSHFSWRYGYMTRKPTNSEVISFISSRIRLESDV